ALAIVAVENIGVIQEMRFEKVEVSVQIVVANPNAHARLLHAIFAQPYTAQDSFFTKRPISIVHEQETWSGIGGNVNVLPTILIEIGGDDGQAICSGSLI